METKISADDIAKDITVETHDGWQVFVLHQSDRHIIMSQEQWKKLVEIMSLSPSG